MDYGSLLLDATNMLRKHHIASARLDALLLLCNATNGDKAGILAHPEIIISDKQYHKFIHDLGQRASGTPMAYICGHKEFYGRDFLVTPDVLIPRPDSESIIDLLIKYTAPACKDDPCNRVEPCNILDVGTGSGCLAITAKLELPEANVTACDISKNVLATAKNNATRLGARISFVHSNLLDEINDELDIILANLPYVPEYFDVSSDVKHEPYLALYAGSDGLQLIRELFSQMPKKLSQGGIVILESLEMQHQAVQNIARDHNFSLLETENLIQVFKFA